jgi:hypothetical protein
LEIFLKVLPGWCRKEKNRLLQIKVLKATSIPKTKHLISRRKVDDRMSVWSGNEQNMKTLERMSELERK